MTPPRGISCRIWARRPRNSDGTIRRASQPRPRAIGIDAIAIGRGHRYRIVVSDLIRGRPIWFGGQDRSEASLAQFYAWLGGVLHVQIIGTFAGLALAHTLLATPFVVIAVASTLAGFDWNLSRAAASLARSKRTCASFSAMPRAGATLLHFAFCTSP